MHFNVTLSAFVESLLHWKCNTYHIFLVCMCSLRFPECNAHAPYCPTVLYNIFPQYLTNDTIFGKKFFGIKCVFLITVELFSETLFFLSRIELTWSGMCVRLHVKCPLYSCQILMELEFSRHVFVKYSNIELSWESVQWKPNCFTRRDGLTDRHGEANSSFWKFCKRT